jgi:hypothetical protein
LETAPDSVSLYVLEEGKQLVGGGWSAVARVEGRGRQTVLYTGIEHLEQFRMTES